MTGTRRRLVVVGALAVLLAAACSSSSKSGATGAGTTSTEATSTGAAGTGTTSTGHTYKIGLLTDLTGPVASATLSAPMGVKAGVGLANSEGNHIDYVVADTGSTPNGALAAAQELVEHDHVFAVLAVSGLTFGAASFLASHGVPVIGSASDGPEWVTSRNMFSVYGAADYTKVYTTFGLFLKLVGVTNLASIGFSISPSSAESAKGTAVSAEAAGIKVGYLNASLPFGTKDVGPAALAMKSAGVDGYSGAVGTDTSFAIVTALRQEGVELKGSILATGYGGDLAQGGPSATQIAQGLDFASSFEPVEMETPATQQLQNAMKTYAGVTTDPTYAEYLGYVSVDAFVTGLKAAGPNPTQAAFINAMLGITDYTASGLFGDHSVSFGLANRGDTTGADDCTWFVKFSGTTFHLISGADPICGSRIPGKTVSPSS